MGDQKQGGSMRSPQIKSLADFLLTPEVAVRESVVTASLPIDFTDSYNSAPVNPILGQLYRAVVVQNSGCLRVNFGDKHDGQVPDWEFRALSDGLLSNWPPGTKVTVMTLRPEMAPDDFWPVSLLFASPEVFASRMRPISVRVEEVNCQKKFDENGNFVEATGKGVNVRIGPFKAFVPISELSVFANQRLEGAELIEALQKLVGKHLDVCVLDCQVSGTMLSIICSQKEASWRDLLPELRIGATLAGTVARFTDKKGTLVNLGGGVNGYIHISELTLDRVQHPSEVVSVGQKVRALVLDFGEEDGRRRISLSRKALLPDPWNDTSVIPSEGTEVTGIVNHIPDEGYGCFVRIVGYEGLSGLVHVSELTKLSPTEPTHPREIVEVGERLQLVVQRVDTNRRRMSFGLKSPVESLLAFLRVEEPTSRVGELLDFLATEEPKSMADLLGFLQGGGVQRDSVEGLLTFLGGHA